MIYAENHLCGNCDFGLSVTFSVEYFILPCAGVTESRSYLDLSIQRHDNNMLQDTKSQVLLLQSLISEAPLRVDLRVERGNPAF